MTKVVPAAALHVCTSHLQTPQCLCLPIQHQRTPVVPSTNLLPPPRPQREQDEQMKAKTREPVRHTATPSHHSRPKPEHCGRLRSSPRRTQKRPGARRHHSWARGIDSSARLESVAHVENTVMDVYYRNDSMKSANWRRYCKLPVVEIEQFGAGLDTYKVA